MAAKAAIWPIPADIAQPPRQPARAPLSPCFPAPSAIFRVHPPSSGLPADYGVNSQAGRRREAHAVGQCKVGLTSVAQKLTQYPVVYAIKICHLLQKTSENAYLCNT